MNANLNRTLTLAENDICFDYTDDAQSLRVLMDNIEIKTEYVGFDKYWDTDKEKRNIIRVYITDKRDGASVDFRFGMSLNDTEILNLVASPYTEYWRFKNIGCQNMNDVRKKAQKVVADLLYSILTTIKLEYYCPSTFEDFCCEFGYDIDSRSAFDSYQALSKMSGRLHKIFDAQEIECLPS